MDHFPDKSCRILFLQFKVGNAFSSIFATEACGYFRMGTDALNRKAFSKTSLKLIFLLLHETRTMVRVLNGL
jgi:hypothetical protein